MTLFAFAALQPAAYADNSWGCYHWARTSNPFTLKLGDNVSSTWDPYLAEASSDWSIAASLDTTVVAGGTTPRKCRATRGQVEVCSEKYGFNGWLGIAQIWASGCHITQSIVKMNDSYFNTSTYNTPAWRRLVMCQEPGHSLGLDHQDETFNNPNLGTCMDYTNDPDGPPSNEHPNAHDYAQLESIYEHLDSSTTVGQTTSTMPPAMTQLELEGPGQWGRLIREGNSGRTQLFELDFGGGYKIFTFVTWADGEERGRGR